MNYQWPVAGVGRAADLDGERLCGLSLFVSSGLSLSPSSAATVSPGQVAVPFHLPTDPGESSAVKQHGVPRKGGLVGVHRVKSRNLLQVWTGPLESSTWFNPVPVAFRDKSQIPGPGFFIIWLLSDQLSPTPHTTENEKGCPSRLVAQ